VDGRVAHRWVFTGTDEGELMSLEPTGKKVEAWGMEINHVIDSRISGSWTVSDALNLM
jgi:predicted ester cyclase